MPDDIDRLWNYQKPAETEAKFRELLPRARESEDRAYLAELLTQIARTYSLRRMFDDAHRTLDEVEAMLIDEDSMAGVRTRYLLERGRAFNSAGEVEKALPLFRRAIDGAHAAKQIRLEIDAIHMVAIAEKDPREQLKWNLQGLALVERNPGERGWLWSLLNNMGEAYLAIEDYPKALATFERLRDYQIEKEGQPDVYTLKDIAKCLRLLERYNEAIALLASIDKQDNGWISEELAESLVAVGKGGEAKPHFVRALDLLSKDDWVIHHEPQRLERLKKRL